MWAKGLLCLEAAVELLIGHELWLWREDFAHVAALGFGWHVFTGQAMVWLDFIAAGHALESGVLPCSSSERQLLLIAASIAEGRPVDLREALSGLDETDTGLVVRAVVHAAGHGGEGDDRAVAPSVAGPLLDGPGAGLPPRPAGVAAGAARRQQDPRSGGVDRPQRQ